MMATPFLILSHQDIPYDNDRESSVKALCMETWHRDVKILLKI